MAFQVGSFVRGQPLTLTWNAAGSVETIFVGGYTIDPGAVHYFSCTVPDTGSLVIPAALTSRLLPRAATQSYVFLQRRSFVTFEPPSPFVVQRVYFARQVLRDLKYQP